MKPERRGPEKRKKRKRKKERDKKERKKKKKKKERRKFVYKTNLCYYNFIIKYLLQSITSETHYLLT